MRKTLFLILGLSFFGIVVPLLAQDAVPVEIGLKNWPRWAEPNVLFQDTLVITTKINVKIHSFAVSGNFWSGITHSFAPLDTIPLTPADTYFVAFQGTSGDSSLFLDVSGQAFVTDSTLGTVQLGFSRGLDLSLAGYTRSGRKLTLMRAYDVPPLSEVDTSLPKPEPYDFGEETPIEASTTDEITSQARIQTFRLYGTVLIPGKRIGYKDGKPVYDTPTPLDGATVVLTSTPGTMVQSSDCVGYLFCPCIECIDNYARSYETPDPFEYPHLILAKTTTGVGGNYELTFRTPTNIEGIFRCGGISIWVVYANGSVSLGQIAEGYNLWDNYIVGTEDWHWSDCSQVPPWNPIYELDVSEVRKDFYVYEYRDEAILLNRLMKLWRITWANTGMNLPLVNVTYPNGYHNTFYNFGTISIGKSDNDEFTLGRLYGLHYLDQYFPVSERPGWNCDGVCDADGCGYCRWCGEESSWATFRDGFAEWFGNWAEPYLKYGTINRFESLRLDCTGPWEEKPGAFAAVLNDLEDDEQDDDPQTPGFKDKSNDPLNKIFATIRNHQLHSFHEPPYSVSDFYEDYSPCFYDYWETWRNNGFMYDDGIPLEPSIRADAMSHQVSRGFVVLSRGPWWLQVGAIAAGAFYA